MAKVTTMKNFKDSAIKMAKEHPDLIPLFTDVGYGKHSVPTKKRKAFIMGEVRIPADAFKEEFQNDLRTVDDLTIKTIVFIPKHMASDKVIKILESQ